MLVKLQLIIYCIGVAVRLPTGKVWVNYIFSFNLFIFGGEQHLFKLIKISIHKVYILTIYVVTHSMNSSKEKLTIDEGLS